jgi:hypothetical protein
MSDPSPDGLGVEGQGEIDLTLPLGRDALIKSFARHKLLNGRPRDEIARHVNAELVAHGLNPLSPGSIYRIIYYGGNIAHSRDRKKQRRQRDPRLVESNASRTNIRQSNDERQFESMLNAPPGKLNNPLIRTAELVQHALVELMNIPPEVAVTQIPIERCRQWTPEYAAWWSEFTRLCEERRRAETPDVPMMPYPRREKIVPRVPRPRQEYQLSAIQAVVYAWLVEHGPATQIDITAGTSQPKGSVFSAITRLELYGLVRDTTPALRVGKIFEALPMPDSAGA